MDGFNNIRQVVLILDNFVRLSNFLTEARIIAALFFPVWLFCPPIDHLKPLHEEDSQIFRLVVCAAMDSWDDAFHNLRENVKNIDFWYSQFNQNF